jgi:hypothetical protein
VSLCTWCIIQDYEELRLFGLSLGEKQVSGSYHLDAESQLLTKSSFLLHCAVILSSTSKRRSGFLPCRQKERLRLWLTFKQSRMEYLASANAPFDQSLQGTVSVLSRRARSVRYLYKDEYFHELWEHLWMIFVYRVQISEWRPSHTIKISRTVQSIYITDLWSYTRCKRTIPYWQQALYTIPYK